MDNLITCEFCGTVYRPDDGCCPICQGRPEHFENYMGDHYDYDERPIEKEPVRRKTGGKVAALIALIALFIGFTGYIVYSFELLPFFKPSSTSAESELIPCSRLAVDAAELRLTKAGQHVQLLAAVEPVNTTDRIIFSVDDSSIISITQDGAVTAKAPGEAKITVICGKFSVDCKVTCSFNAQ